MQKVLCFLCVFSVIFSYLCRQNDEKNMISYLNTENIARSTDSVEYHPLRPFLPKNARVLFLGSFPPQRKRWCMDFYYPNFINDHWRIEGQIFFGDKNHFVDLEAKRFKIDEIVAFCQEKGLAFYDTSTAIRRLQDNASDKFLEVVEPTDIHALLQQLPHCLISLRNTVLTIVVTCFSLSQPMGALCVSGAMLSQKPLPPLRCRNMPWPLAI